MTFGTKMMMGGTGGTAPPGGGNSTVIPIGLAHQDSTMYQAKGITVANNVLVVASHYNNRVVTLSLGANPSVLGYVEDNTNLSGPTPIAKINDTYVIVGAENGADATTVNISNPASPTVTDSVPLTANSPRHCIYGGGDALLCSQLGNVGRVDASIPTAISETTFDGWDGYTAYAFGWDSVNDILFVADETYLESVGGYPSNFVDSETLSAGIPIGMYVDSTNRTLTVCMVNLSGNLVVNTFTYTVGGVLTSAGSTSSTDGLGATEPVVGCVYGYDTTIEVFTAQSSFIDSNHYTVDISSIGSPTIMVNSVVPNLNQPHSAVAHNNFIYVTDFGDEV